jgi:uncharacterized protein
MKLAKYIHLFLGVSAARIDRSCSDGQNACNANQRKTMSELYVPPELRVLPDPSMESKAFWTGGEQGQLLIYRCGACTQFFHPPAPVCFRCRSTNVGPEAVSGKATVTTYSVNRHPWYPSFPPPYIVAIVELNEQPDVRLTTNIVGCSTEAIQVGMKVEVLFEHCDDVWIPLFKPITTITPSDPGSVTVSSASSMETSAS